MIYQRKFPNELLTLNIVIFDLCLQPHVAAHLKELLS